MPGRPARNWKRPLLLLAAVLVCWAASPVAGATATAVSVLAYLWSCVRHARRACWHCGGSGLRYNRVWQGAAGRCKACEGSKAQVRWGTRVLMPGYARRLRDGKPTRYG